VCIFLYGGIDGGYIVAARYGVGAMDGAIESDIDAIVWDMGAIIKGIFLLVKLVEALVPSVSGMMVVLYLRYYCHFEL